MANRSRSSLKGRARVTQVRHKLLPKQEELIFSTHRHTVYSGAVGAGKSRALCIDALIHCSLRPETRYGLFQKTLTGLKKSTIKTLLHGDGHAPPILPPGQYRHNKNDAEIQLNGGGTILYSGVENPESVRSMNLTRAGVDEVTQLQPDDYNAIDDRVRVDIGDPLCVVSATNPATPSHWLAKMMGMSPEKAEPDPGCKIILTKTSDNTYLPKAYVDGFERHRGTVYYRRMFLGEWCGSDGMVYDKWDRAINVCVVTDPPKKVVLGVDDGYGDPFVVLRYHVWGKRKHVAREVYETKLVESEKIDHIRRMLDSPDDVVVVDNSAAAFIESLRRHNINAVPCKKGPGSIEQGVLLVQSSLLPDESGTPELTVDPACVNTIREFESWERRPSQDGYGDKYIDRDNHTMDAARYVATHLNGGFGATITVGGASMVNPAVSDPDRGWGRWN
jgi:PBSX family phage terminase large subunit